MMLSLSEAKASLQSSGPHPAVEGFEGDRGGAVNDKNSGAAGNGSSFGAEAAAVLKGAKNDISNLVPTRLRIQLTPTKLALAPGSSSMLLETAHTQVGTGSGPASTSKLQQSAILLKDTGPILWPERGAVASSGPVDNDNNVDSWLVPNRQAPTKEAPVGVQSSRGHTGSGNVSFTPDAMQPHRASSSGSVNVLVVEQCGGSESSGLDDEELKGAYRVETKDANIHHSINQVAQVTLGAPVVAPITVQLAAPTVPHTHVRSAPADHAYGNTRGHAASGVHADTTLKHAFDDATDNEDDIRRGGGKHALAHPAAQDDAARHVPSPKAQQSQQQAPALHPSTAAAWSRFLSMTEAMIALMENSSMQLKQESVTPTEVDFVTTRLEEALSRLTGDDGPLCDDNDPDGEDEDGVVPSATRSMPRYMYAYCAHVGASISLQLAHLGLARMPQPAASGSMAADGLEQQLQELMLSKEQGAPGRASSRRFSAAGRASMIARTSLTGTGAAASAAGRTSASGSLLSAGLGAAAAASGLQPSLALPSSFGPSILASPGAKLQTMPSSLSNSAGVPHATAGASSEAARRAAQQEEKHAWGVIRHALMALRLQGRAVEALMSGGAQVAPHTGMATHAALSCQASLPRAVVGLAILLQRLLSYLLLLLGPVCCGGPEPCLDVLHNAMRRYVPHALLEPDDEGDDADGNEHGTASGAHHLGSGRRGGGVSLLDCFTQVDHVLGALIQWRGSGGADDDGGASAKLLVTVPLLVAQLERAEQLLNGSLQGLLKVAQDPLGSIQGHAKAAHSLRGMAEAAQDLLEQHAAYINTQAAAIAASLALSHSSMAAPAAAGAGATTAGPAGAAAGSDAAAAGGLLPVGGRSLVRSGTSVSGRVSGSGSGAMGTGISGGVAALARQASMSMSGRVSGSGAAALARQASMSGSARTSFTGGMASTTTGAAAAAAGAFSGASASAGIAVLAPGVLGLADGVSLYLAVNTEPVSMDSITAELNAEMNADSFDAQHSDFDHDAHQAHHGTHGHHDPNEASLQHAYNRNAAPPAASGHGLAPGSGPGPGPVVSKDTGGSCGDGVDGGGGGGGLPPIPDVDYEGDASSRLMSRLMDEAVTGMQAVHAEHAHAHGSHHHHHHDHHAAGHGHVHHARHHGAVLSDLHDMEDADDDDDDDGEEGHDRHGGRDTFSAPGRRLNRSISSAAAEHGGSSRQSTLSAVPAANSGRVLGRSISHFQLGAVHHSNNSGRSPRLSGSGMSGSGMYSSPVPAGSSAHSSFSRRTSAAISREQSMSAAGPGASGGTMHNLQRMSSFLSAAGLPSSSTKSALDHLLTPPAAGTRTSSTPSLLTVRGGGSGLAGMGLGTGASPRLSGSGILTGPASTTSSFSMPISASAAVGGVVGSEDASSAARLLQKRMSFSSNSMRLRTAAMDAEHCPNGGSSQAGDRHADTTNALGATVLQPYSPRAGRLGGPLSVGRTSLRASSSMLTTQRSTCSASNVHLYTELLCPTGLVVDGHDPQHHDHDHDHHDHHHHHDSHDDVMINGATDALRKPPQRASASGSGIGAHSGHGRVAAGHTGGYTADSTLLHAEATSSSGAADSKVLAEIASAASRGPWSLLVYLSEQFPVTGTTAGTGAVAGITSLAHAAGSGGAAPMASAAAAGLLAKSPSMMCRTSASGQQDLLIGGTSVPAGSGLGLGINTSGAATASAGGLGLMRNASIARGGPVAAAAGSSASALGGGAQQRTSLNGAGAAVQWQLHAGGPTDGKLPAQLGTAIKLYESAGKASKAAQRRSSLVVTTTDAVGAEWEGAAVPASSSSVIQAATASPAVYRFIVSSLKEQLARLADN